VGRGSGRKINQGAAPDRTREGFQVGRGSGRKINQGAAPDRERLRTGSGSGPAVPDRCVA
jgi:hypothetical protein